MESFSVRTELTPTDWQAYQKTCALRLQQHQPRNSRVIGIIVSVAFGLAAMSLLDLLNVDLNPVSGVFGFLLAVTLFVMAHRRGKAAAVPDPDGSFFSPSEYRFSADGIEVTQQGLNSRLAWSRVRNITTSAEHIYLWADRFAANVVPIRDLPAGSAVGQVVAQLQAWAAQKPVDEIAEAAPAAPVATQNEFLVTLRLLALRRVEAPALTGSVGAVVLLTALSLALWAGLDWFGKLPDPEFYPYDAGTLAWFILAALLAALAMAKRSHPAIPLARVCVLVATVVPVLIVANFVIEQIIGGRWAALASLLLLIYFVLYCANGLASITGVRQPAAGAAGALIVLGAWWLGSVLYIQPSMWIERSALEEASGESNWDASEALLFEQPARIDAAVASIKRPTQERPVGFFVGFAGYGEQKVFAEEIKFAGRVFDRHYDTSSRTMLLLNDQRGLDQQPLASVSGLRYALKRVASKMRLDRDVLFLALSSHGSEDATLSVSNGSVPLRDLSNEDLAQALAESGIKWRVVVISACYSGAFIESLRNPQTIVIAAAAPDRTSFGCSNDRDMTYFGEALFRDSMPQAPSLRAAFNAAKKLVVQREKEEGERPSNPQAFFGEQMERKLVTMERPRQ